MCSRGAEYGMGLLALLAFAGRGQGVSSILQKGAREISAEKRVAETTSHERVGNQFFVDSIHFTVIYSLLPRPASVSVQ